MLLFSRFKISGHSMEPILRDGEQVIATNLPLFFRMLKINDIIVFKKYGKFFVKKISKITKDQYFVIGENKNDSLDSRKFGLVSFKDILGKVIFKF